MQHGKDKVGGVKWQFGAGDWARGGHGGETVVETPLTVEDGTVGVDAAGTDAVVAKVTYSDAAIAELLYMIEEEKLAGDIYELFHEMYGLKVFDNIAASEDRHFDSLIAQAEALGIDTDSFVFAEAGSFEDPDLQGLYDDLVATGSVSVTAALKVGAAIETRDMVDIAAAIEDVEGTTLAGLYENLLAGSANHLEAFEGLLA